MKTAQPKTPIKSSDIGAKVMSIGGDAPTSKPKVMTIGAVTKTLPTEDKDNSVAGDGSKAAAAKAIEKTERGSEKSKSSSVPDSTQSSGRSSPSTTPGEAKVATREADAVAKEQAVDVDEETLEEVYGKEHVNLIFIGHVDAGKSTLGGSILYATGMVDERTMDKYKREAKEAGRETWYLSWALDLTKEERAKGKTVEVGRGFFETDRRRYTILDAPGHKTFVPNMIGGASQADVGILVISARKGEYETGFEKGGQTREHAMLAKTQGVNKLIVAVNKMDDPTVEWSKERYEECTTKLRVFLKGTGYDPKTGKRRDDSPTPPPPCLLITPDHRSDLHAHLRTNHHRDQDPCAEGASAMVRWSLSARIPRRHEDVGAQDQRPFHDAHQREVPRKFLLPIASSAVILTACSGHGHSDRRQDRVRGDQEGRDIHHDAESEPSRRGGAVRRDGGGNRDGSLRRPGPHPGAWRRGRGHPPRLCSLFAQATGTLRLCV